MAMGKSFRIYDKINDGGPYSVLLEHRARHETLLFESGTVSILCK